MAEQVQVQREPVIRAIQVLTWIAEHPDVRWSVRKVARDMKTSPTTVHRIFGIFESRGLLEKDGNGGYIPSIGLYKLSRSIASQDVAVAVGRDHIDTLALACGETTMLAAYDARRLETLYVYVHLAHHPVQHIVVPNVWRPFSEGSTSLAILAFLPEDEREAVYSHGLTRSADQTETDVERLEHELARIREKGFVRARGHRTIGAVGTAAPVFDSGGNVFGCVCVTIPDQRWGEALADEVGKQVLKAAAAVTAGLRAAGLVRPTLVE